MSDEVTVPAGSKLTVSPGARVMFKGKGRIQCRGAFHAEGAQFEAEEAVEGQQRFVFASSRSVPVTFTRCALRNLITTKLRYHNAFFTAIYARVTMRDCVIENTSTLEIMHTTAPVLTGNRFMRNVHRGVMVIACDRALVQGNHFELCAPNRPMLILLTSRNCRILENRFFGANRCIGLTIGGRSHTNRAVANSFFTCLFGIEFSGGKNPRNMLLGNLVFKPRYSGMRIRKCDERTLIRNCVVWGAGCAGIEIEEAGELTVQNCVFAKCAQSTILSSAAVPVEFRHNCIWQSSREGSEVPRALAQASTNIQTDPMFVDPEAGNFRLMTTAFGHPKDSPLLRAGTPAGTCIGLYP